MPTVCGGRVGSGDSSGTSGVDCVGGCFENYVVFCCLMCCVSDCSGGSSGTGGMDCVLQIVSNTMLFSVA